MSNYYYEYQPRKPAAISIWPILLLVGLCGFLAWRFWPHHEDNGLDPNATPRPVMARGDLSGDEKATIDLYRQTSPSVVHVTRLAERRDFSFNISQIPAGTGSGFVWDEEGHIVTNNHVVQGADGFQVVLADHSKWDATVVGTQADTDLAVLKIEAPKERLHPILVGSSHDLQVGQKAFAIGNPFGLDQSLTTGVVSALDREITAENHRPIKGAIQTNAAINPGNSGGPLLDSAGRLIGVNTAILSPSGASAGIGFAIPVDDVNRIVPQLIRSGHIFRPGLGVRVANDRLNQQLGVDGLQIMDVVPNSPAAKAGLRPTRRDEDGRINWGDVIVAIDKQPIKSFTDLYSALDQHKVGDAITVTVKRDDEVNNVQINLEAIR